MAVSYQTFRDLLDEAELKYYADEQRGWFLLPYRHWAITVQLAADGLIFRVPYLGRRQDWSKPKRTMQFLLAENSRLKVGQYIVEPDGELLASHFLLWLDQEPTLEVIQRVFRSLCGLARRLPDVLEGKSPPWSRRGSSRSERPRPDESAPDADSDADDEAEPPARADVRQGRGQREDGIRRMLDQLLNDLLEHDIADSDLEADLEAGTDDTTESDEGDPPDV